MPGGATSLRRSASAAAILWDLTLIRYALVILAIGVGVMCRLDVERLSLLGVLGIHAAVRCIVLFLVIDSSLADVDVNNPRAIVQFSIVHVNTPTDIPLLA